MDIAIYFDGDYDEHIVRADEDDTFFTRHMVPEEMVLAYEKAKAELNRAYADIDCYVSVRYANRIIGTWEKGERA